MSKIFVTRNIPGEAFKKLLESKEHELIVFPHDRPPAPDEIIEMGKDASAVLTLLNIKWTGELMDKFPNLKILSNYAVGFDNIDIKAANERKIIVTNTPSDEVNESVAEFAWTLILALSRRIVEGDEFGRKGAYKGWEPDIFLGRDVYRKTLGIVGLGRIGSMVARRAKGFNLKVLYNSRSRDEEAERELGVEYRELDDLLSESDYVTIHLPLTKETTHLINEEKIAKMKKGAYLVNTARGPIVDESVLATALREGRLAGVALDVHENEPQMNPELMQMENAILTPHIASATVEVREKMTEQAVQAILDVLSGKTPENIVKPHE